MDGHADCKESCSEEDRACAANDPSGTPCDDGVECTLGDNCTGGLCRGTTDNALCDDGDMCTSDRCDTVEGCVTASNGLCN